MSDGVRIEIRPPKDPEYGRATCHIELDQQHQGRAVTFALVRKVKVDDSRAIDKEEEIFRHGFQARAGMTEAFELPGPEGRMYSYQGPQITIELVCRVVVDDGILWDTTVDQAFAYDPFPHPKASGSAQALAEPEDQYDFFKNLYSLPPGRRLAAGLVAVVGLGVIAGHGFVALHDMVATRRTAILYSEAPVGMILQLFLTIFGALITWAIVRHLLGGYVSLTATPPREPLHRGSEVRVRDLIQARALGDIDGMRVRVIACNQEKGQYRRGSGTNTRTVSFARPTRGVVLYDKTLGRVRAGTDLAMDLMEPLDLEPMFDALYPPQAIGTTHGMDVLFEVQLLHDDLVDRKAQIGGENFRWESFLEDRSAGKTGEW